MSEFFKSRLGILLAGIHLLIVFACLLYVAVIDKTAVLPVVLLMILTFPWGTLSLFIPAQLSFFEYDPSIHGEFVFNIGMTIGGLINAFVVYVLGFLLTRAFKYLKSTMSKS